MEDEEIKNVPKKNRAIKQITKKGKRETQGFMVISF